MSQETKLANKAASAEMTVHHTAQAQLAETRQTSPQTTQEAWQTWDRAKGLTHSGTLCQTGSCLPRMPVSVVPGEAQSETKDSWLAVVSQEVTVKESGEPWYQVPVETIAEMTEKPRWKSYEKSKGRVSNAAS